MLARTLAFLFVTTCMAGLAPGASAQEKADPKKAKPDPKKKWDLAGFTKKVEALSPEDQVKIVLEKMQELNPGFQKFVSTNIEDGAVTQVSFYTGYVSDISPIRAFSKLKYLNASGPIGGGKLVDISPLAGLKLETLMIGVNLDLAELTVLKGMPLVTLNCNQTKVASLAPLEGCQTLESLNCDATRVTNLKPLKGLKLRQLTCNSNKGVAGETISDLSPLQGMKLEKLGCAVCAVRDFSVIKEMPIWHLNIGETQIVDFSVLKNLPLTELYIHKTRFTEKDGAFLKDKSITILHVSSTPIRDLLFAKGMPLITLGCHSCPLLKDLQGLKDSKLEIINCAATPIKDLKPLEGLPLKTVNCTDTNVTSLDPLKDAPLEEVYCGWNTLKGIAPLGDLSPLSGKKIKYLACANSAVKDLKPIAGAPLIALNCQNTAIKDLTPLAGAPITTLKCQGTRVVDFKPLKDCTKLETLNCDFMLPRDKPALKAIKTLKKLNDADPDIVLK